MSDRDIMALLNRADAADKRMQYLQNEIDLRTHWLDAAKERIKVLEERLNNSAAAHADEFAKLEKRLDALESTLAPRHP